MRKVKFKVWIPLMFSKADLSVLPGTNQWSDDYRETGKFHTWGQTYEEFETNAGNRTVAIIEKENGEVVQVEPFNIKFVDVVRVKFKDAPVGARFKFIGDSEGDVYVKIHSNDNGLIVQWNGNIEDRQSHCCWIDDDHDFETEIELIP